MNACNRRSVQQGFTLVEMALVLLILGLLTKTLIVPLSSLHEHAKRRQAHTQLQTVRDAVFAHLVAYGALPCPLSDTPPYSSPFGAVDDALNTITGIQQVCAESSGFLAAYPLRLAGAVNDQGALLDPWGRELHYAVSLSNAREHGNEKLPDWTTPGEAGAVGIANLSADLVLCNVAVSGRCTGRDIRANQIAFVVLSTGADASTQGAQADNQDSDLYFTVTEESIVPGAQYDDLLVWGSAADSLYWMLRMGWLP